MNPKAWEKSLRKKPLTGYLEKSQRRPSILCHPTVPEPLHNVNPRSVLGSQWWDKTRLEAYRSTNFHCITCGIARGRTKNCRLDGHEVYNIDYLLGRMYYVETAPLCVTCHDFIHIGRLQSLLSKGQITAQRLALTVQHGEEVLFNTNLIKPPPYEGPSVEWGEWRLVAFGKEYPPKYETFEEWRQKFEPN